MPRRPRIAGGEFVLHARSGGAALLGLDQHHAVRRARSVDRGSSSILEDRDGLNVRGVDEIERVARERRIAADADSTRVGLISRHRDAVDHQQRLVAAGNRSAATNENVRARARLTVVLGDLNAGGPAFDHVGDVGRYGDFCVVAVDGGHRSGDRQSTLGAVSGGHYFLEDGRLAIHREDRADATAVGNHNHLHRGAKADSPGAHRLGAGGYTSNRERTVGTCDGSASRAFNEDTDIGHGLLRVGIDDASRDGARGWDRVLGAESDRTQQANHQRESETTNYCHTRVLHENWGWDISVLTTLAWG